MKKINRFNKMADRVIIVTDSAIYKLDGCKKKFKNMKKAVHIKDVSCEFYFVMNLRFNS